jgi:uncharacterized protein (TIGR03546 family)
MYSFFDFIKNLNSTQATFQLSLALMFGMISGFLPFFSLINIFLLLIIFLLNVPLGVYSVFVLSFTIVGAMLDSTFASIGYDLLTNQDLVGFWTTLYNIKPFLWFNFNHTITLGSFVVSLILAMPLYFISKPIFSKYKIYFLKLSQKIKIFKWLVPVDDTTKKVRLFRLWGAGLFISVIGVILAFFILFLDPIIKFTLEYILSTVTRTTVTIDKAVTNIKTTKLELKNIRIVKDNKANTIENVLIDFDTNHLLSKKFDITNIDIKNINIDDTIVAPKTKTSLENNSKSNSSSTINKDDFKKNFKIDLPNIDKMLEKENLKSIGEAKNIKKRFNDIHTKWKDISKKSSSEILQDIKYYRDEFNKDKAILLSDINKIKTLRNNDYKYLTSKYGFNKNAVFNIIETYISSDLAKYIKLAQKYYNQIKPYLQDDEEEEEIKRLEGRWIEFKEISPCPIFIIRDVTANIVSKKFDSCNISLVNKNKITIDINIQNIQSSKLAKLKKYISSDTNINLNILGVIKTLDKLSDSKISVRSNLDRALKEALKLKFQRQLAKYKVKLKNMIQKKIQDEIGDIDIDKFKNYEDILKNGIKEKIKKKIEDKIKKKIKEKIQDKIKDKLENKLNDKIKDKLKDKLNDFLKF